MNHRFWRRSFRGCCFLQKGGNAMENIIIFLLLLFLDSIARIVEKIIDCKARKSKKKRRDGSKKH